MASIKKRPNGTYQATIYTGRDENGKPLKPEYVTRITLKECKAAAREIEQNIADGKFVRVDNVRVMALIEMHIRVNRNSYSPSTRSLYKSYVKNHYEPFFGNKKVKDINEYHAKEFKNIVIGECPGSARRILSFIKTVFRDAMRDKSPFKELKLPKESKVTYNIPETEEFQTIHEGFFGTEYEPKILLAGWAGLRREEIFALKPNDLNFNDNIIKIDEAYVINDDGKFEFKDPKSENGFRDIVAPQYLMDLLKPIAEERTLSLMNTDLSMLTKEEIEERKRLFQGRPDNFSSSFAKMIRRKNLPKVRFHDLRHYQATWLHDNDFPDDYAAKRLGHTKAVLKAIYQHLRPQKEKGLDDKIAKLHDKRPNKQKYKYTKKLKRSI
jgi:integrase